MPGQVTAEQIADYLIHFSHEVGDPITNLKLQKLLYYAQAWYLALHDKPLFDDQIEAWVRGPVVPNVWRKYKDYRWSPIGTDPGVVKLSDEIKTHLDEIMKVYGTLPAFHLERLTHQETPWKNARGGLAADEPSNEIILLDDMKDFYRQMAQEDGNQVEGVSLSQLVSRLVDTALELAEDLALVQVAEQRLATFRRDDMLKSEHLTRPSKPKKRRKSA